MKKIDQDFYIWTMYECIKTTSEYWGIDFTSMLDNVKRDFPNVYKAFMQLYGTDRQKELYLIEATKIENPQAVYELIANMLPISKSYLFNTTTQPQAYKYRYLHMCRWDRKVRTARCDLLLSVLLFTEDFIFEKVSSKQVVFSKNKLIVYGKCNTLKISVKENITYICINIRGVMKFQYEICAN